VDKAKALAELEAAKKAAFKRIKAQLDAKRVEANKAKAEHQRMIDAVRAENPKTFRTTCAICHKELKDIKSMARGIGPDCWTNYPLQRGRGRQMA
jgi:cytochrome c5